MERGERRAGPAAVHPRVAEAIRLQLERRRDALAAGAQRVGWKLGRDIAEIEAVAGADPVVGHLTTATLLRTGGVYCASDGQSLRAETELVVDLGRDLGGGAEAGVALEAVAGVAVGLELVDVRRPPGDLEGIVAANVFHRASVLGPPRPVERAEGRRATLSVNGELRETATVASDPVEVVRAIASLLEAVGERLLAGDRVLAGSSTHVPVGPGDAIVAAIDGLGSVAAAVRARSGPALRSARG